MRGKILGLKREEAVRRVMSMIVAMPAGIDGPKPINYRLKDYNGGDDPTAPVCSNMSYGNRTPTSDCIGLVLWASGVDRKQPGYNGSRGEWLNCASLLDDADNEGKYCRKLRMGEKAKPGDWLMTRDHIGMIIRVDEGPDGDHLVVDCSPRHGRTHAVNTGYPWSDACVVVRPSALIYPEG